MAHMMNKMLLWLPFSFYQLKIYKSQQPVLIAISSTCHMQSFCYQKVWNIEKNGLISLPLLLQHIPIHFLNQPNATAKKEKSLNFLHGLHHTTIKEWWWKNYWISNKKEFRVIQVQGPDLTTALLYYRNATWCHACTTWR